MEPVNERGECFVHQLAPLDHTSPRIHTAKLVYFCTNENPDKIFITLRDALAKSISAFPIIGGSVGLMKQAPRLGTLAVQAPFFTAEEVLTKKDLRETYDYEAIRKEDFPADAVDFKLVVPDLGANHSRVLLVQANFIHGGLVLTVAVHHNVVDEAGIFMIMKLLASYCRGDDGSLLIKPEWTDITPLLSGKGTGRLEDHPEYKLRSAEDSATRITTYQEYIAGKGTTASAILFFSDEALERLKKAAKRVEAVPWISTNDALCALVWSCATAARKLGEDVPYSMFNMVVDGRAKMDPPMTSEYIGNVVFVTTRSILSIPSLDAANIADTALNIRASVLAINDEVIKDKIAAVMGVDDIGRLAPGGYSSLGRHLACTSWAGQPYYTLDWGKELGGVKRLRFPKTLSDGIFVIFPRIPADNAGLGEGGIEVQIGLDKAVLERLRGDKALNQYVQWR
ncbi:Fumigaclavine B O-acetyltransferase [Lachnellula occidentalis]|uniref:Fumigaclavine B O-acetyltransferase n=1 Tax=Lachnellula occidentalis TaxID=215460 RepID=A0A8H8S0G7_9HELO|nr:Fumigaclavine B O-acetyltransferase [Lachnellula occidentalis]